MYWLTYKNFIRSKSVVATLVLFMLTGIISILIGKQFLQKQEKSIKTVTISQQEHIKRNADYIKDDYGQLLYYLRFAYINKSEPITALAIGQRDVNSNIQSLTIRGVEAQLYDTDLYNPYNLLIGNFDFSFVVIFLFPLLIIAFSYNLFSLEKEGGTWTLVNSQSTHLFRFMLQKISVRMLTVLALLGSLLLLAKLIIGIPFDENFISFSLVSVLYVVVWFAIAFFIVSLRKSSALSALFLLSAWLLLCFLIPGFVNNYITAKHPIPQAYSTLLKQRDGYHTKWDKNKDSTMAAFFTHYPQYAHYKWTKQSFDYLWYYAMQQLGDDEALEDSRAMKKKLRQRQQLSQTISYFFPSMHTQLQLTDLTGSGLSHHLAFLDSAVKFHEAKRLYFYPKIFGTLKTDQENWSQQVPEYFSADKEPVCRRLIIPLITYLVVLVMLSLLLFKKIKH